MIQLKKQQHGKSNLIVSDKLHSVQLSMFSVGTGELDPEIILSLPPLWFWTPYPLTLCCHVVRRTTYNCHYKVKRASKSNL